MGVTEEMGLDIVGLMMPLGAQLGNWEIQELSPRP